MDTSKEYILQCEKAVKLQEDILKSVSVDGFVATVNYPDSKVMLFYKDDYYTLVDTGHGNSVILPTQDQLQAMITSDWRKALALISAYAKHFDTSHVTSMEQLWLAYVMFDKYRKQWDGADWTPIKEVI